MSEKKNREFVVEHEDGSKKKYMIRRATVKEQNEANFIYTKEFYHALNNGIMPSVKLAELLQSTGAWTMEHEKELSNRTDRVIDMLSELDTVDENEKLGHAILLRAERAHCAALRAEKFQLFAHSAERLAESAQRDFMVASTTLNEDGSKVWKTLDEYGEETNSDLLYGATYAYTAMLNGLDDDISSQMLPEDEVIRSSLLDDVDDDDDDKSDGQEADQDKVESEEQSGAEEQSGKDEPAKEKAGNDSPNTTDEVVDATVRPAG